uniref:Uncharacterized protein n=1 Tax=Cacopsylla melanoneura TaxID=428564 RepID=A0A8D8WDQ8_9HEMI
MLEQWCSNFFHRGAPNGFIIILVCTNNYQTTALTSKLPSWEGLREITNLDKGETCTCSIGLLFFIQVSSVVKIVLKLSHNHFPLKYILQIKRSSGFKRTQNILIVET